MSLTVFDFQDQQITFIDDMPIASDVATALGYSNPYDAIKRHVSENNLLHSVSRITSGKTITVLKEAGIYQLIFGSKLPSAIMFQQWVFEQVLPSIRKTGSYSVANNAIPTLKADIERKKLILESLKLDKQIKQLQAEATLEELLNVKDGLSLLESKVLAIVERYGECTAVEIRNYMGGGKCTFSATQLGTVAIQLVEKGYVHRVPTKKGVRVAV